MFKTYAMLKNSITVILLLVVLSSCLTDNDKPLDPTIDWETFSHVISWTETGSKTKNQDWENITDGQKLSLFTNYLNEALNMPDNGKIHYRPSVNTGIENEDYFERTDSTFVIYSSSLPDEADTLIVRYLLVDSTTMIISDASVSPVIEIKYKRAD